MGKKQKKKGAGQEKTIQKANKKAEKSLKKELGGSAGDDVEDIIAELERKEQAAKAVSIETCDPPAPRSHATFTAHPSKDELILFGGEFDNGQTTIVYNDMFVYSIAKNEWKKVSSPNSPLPRSSHQAAALEMNNEAQLWLFGGEFTSPNQSQFYHYNDLWCLHLPTMSWEKVQVKGGPSARSGHRMIVHKRKLVVFGGFYDNGQVVRYYNDLHVFDLDTRAWLKIGAAGQQSSTPLAPVIKAKKDTADAMMAIETAPGPRSGFHFFVNEDKNSAVLYGGYRKEKIKGQVERSTTLQDIWALDLTTFNWTLLKKQPLPPKVAPAGNTKAAKGGKSSGKADPAIAAAAKEKLKSAAAAGAAPGTNGPCVRSGASMCVIPKKRCILFGGALDEESDEDMQSVCMNDMYVLRLDSMKWFPWSMRKPKAKSAAASSSTATTAASSTTAAVSVDSDAKTSDVPEDVEELSSGDELDTDTTPSDDKGHAVATSSATLSAQAHRAAAKEDLSFMPSARYRAMLAVKGSILYMWGGITEVCAPGKTRGHEVAMNDMYALDTVKADGWRVLVRFDPSDSRWQWLGSDDEKSDDDDDDQKDDDDDDDDDDDEDDDDEEDDDDDENDDDDDAKAAVSKKDKKPATGGSKVTPAPAAAGKQKGADSAKKASTPSKKPASGSDVSGKDALTPKAGEPYKLYYERTRALWDQKAEQDLQEQQRREVEDAKNASAPPEVEDDDDRDGDDEDDDDNDDAAAAKPAKKAAPVIVKLSDMSAGDRVKALRKLSAQLAAQYWNDAKP